MKVRTKAKHGKQNGQKPEPILKSRGSDTITLSNPVAKQFEVYIVGNAMKAERVVQANAGHGQTLVIAGAGPSLRDHAAEYCAKADQVWGCNSAVTWLIDHGYKATHGFTVDQTPEMCNEWASAPDVEYLLASTVHPHLTDFLLWRKRRITFFHNYVGLAGKAPVAYSVCQACGDDGVYQATECAGCHAPNPESQMMPYEDWLYSALYAPTIRAGAGLNAVTRALDVALFCGFEKIYVLGADCALRVKSLPPKDAPFGSPKHRAWLAEQTEMHADGGSAVASRQSILTLGGTIDGRHWESKPDLLVTAVFLVKMARQSAGRIELIGDTLPNALKDKPDSFLRRMPTLQDAQGVPLSLFEPEENEQKTETHPLPANTNDRTL